MVIRGANPILLYIRGGFNIKLNKIPRLSDFHGRLHDDREGNRIVGKESLANLSLINLETTLAIAKHAARALEGAIAPPW